MNGGIWRKELVGKHERAQSPSITMAGTIAILVAFLVSRGVWRAGESERIKGLKNLARMAGSQTWELGFG
ncbi:MAG TPA: hypothetical protein DCG39_10430 [Opitutae bacterium]|nr:hypothetical protein [Opitutae bacterium]